MLNFFFQIALMFLCFVLSYKLVKKYLKIDIVYEPETHRFIFGAISILSLGAVIFISLFFTFIFLFFLIKNLLIS